MGGHIGIIGKQGATVPDSWVEYPIFWTMVVALASAGKSQTMRSVFSPIKRRLKQAKTEYKKLKKELEKLEEAWAEKSPQQKEALKDSPENPRVFKATMPSSPSKQLIEAGSPEGALRRMSELPPKSGCAWVFDELVRLLKLDQYKDQGGDTRQILLQTWNAPADIEFERSDEENSFELKDLCLSLTGATQLSKVKALFSDPDDGDGLISRFLIAIPTTSDPHSDHPQKPKTQTSRSTQPPIPRSSDNSDDFWADPISTVSPEEELDRQDNSQNGRNCRNSDSEVPSKLDTEPISEDFSASENCRNDVGNSDNYFDEDSEIELTNESDHQNSDIKLENQSDDDPHPDDNPSGNGNVPKPDKPPAGGGGNEVLSHEETANLLPQSRTTETELIQESLRLREQLREQSDLVREDERRSTFEQLQTLLTSYCTAIAQAQTNSEMPAQNLVSLFTPLDNLLRSWGIEPLGKVWEQVPYNSQLHQPDADDLTEGELVFVRFVGYRDRERILCPAKVSRTRPSVKSCGSE